MDVRVICSHIIIEQSLLLNFLANAYYEIRVIQNGEKNYSKMPRELIMIESPNSFKRCVLNDVFLHFRK